MKIKLFKSEIVHILIEIEFLIEILDDYLLLGLYDEYKNRVEVLGPLMVELFNQMSGDEHLINSMLEKSRFCILLDMATKQCILPQNKKIDAEIMNLEFSNLAHDQLINVIDTIQKIAVFCSHCENEYLKNLKIRLCRPH